MAQEMNLRNPRDQGVILYPERAVSVQAIPGRRMMAAHKTGSEKNSFPMETRALVNDQGKLKCQRLAEWLNS